MSAPSAHSGPDATARRYLIEGRVQGVGFRYFVVEQARTLQLTGTARNLPDGRVEVQAAGPAASLDTLAEALRRGPALSRVTEVQQVEFEQVPDWKDFRITS